MAAAEVLIFEEPRIGAHTHSRPADVLHLCKGTRSPAEALRAWDAAARACNGKSIAPILSLCVEVGSSDGVDTLGGTLVAALTAGLQSGTAGRCMQLLSAVLCHAGRRLKAKAPATFVSALQHALLLAVRRLLVPPDDELAESPTSAPVVRGQGMEESLAGVLEALVCIKNIKKLNGEAVRAVSGVLMRRNGSTTDGVPPGHAGLLRALSRSTLAHEPAAEAMADELRLGGAAMLGSNAYRMCTRCACVHAVPMPPMHAYAPDLCTRMIHVW